MTESMKYYESIRRKYPEAVSKDQFYQIAHISKTLLIKGFLDRHDTIMLDPGKGFGYCRFAPQQGRLSSAS